MNFMSNFVGKRNLYTLRSLSLSRFDVYPKKTLEKKVWCSDLFGLVSWVFLFGRRV